MKRKKTPQKKGKRSLRTHKQSYHDHIHQYMDEVQMIARQIDREAINDMINILVKLRDAKGRLFFLGVGGSAANASHAVNDFRKIGHMEAYTPVDNVAELTARTNDDGWETIFARWLERSGLNNKDAIMVFSVGGGNAEKNISANIVHALDHAKKKGAKIMGIVSRDGGYTAKMADACVIVPVVNPDNVTAHAESWQAVIWHSMVLHPLFKRIEATWESIEKK
jgi:D-sedoheptulose 7-phosphate isomerase